MFVYWAIFLVLAIGALLNQQANQSRGRWLFMLLASLPTALMIGLRWQIGPDWVNYLDQFNYTKLFTLSRALTHLDPGYFTLNWLMHQFRAPFWVLNFVCGTIFVAGLTAFCLRQPNPWLAYLVALPYLVIVVAMSGNRQSVALGLLFFALNAFERGRLNRCVLFTLMAALFHGSVALMLPLCLLSYTSNSMQRMLLLILAAALAAYFFQDVFSVYARRYGSEKIQSTGVAYRLAMNALSAVLFIALQRRFGLDAHQTTLWRNVSLLSLVLILLVLVLPSSTAVDRFLLYLFPLQFVVLNRLPQVVASNRSGITQATAAVIGYAAAVQMTFLTFGVFASAYLPYRSLFDA